LYIIAVLFFGFKGDGNYYGSAFTKIDIRLAPLLIIFTQSIWFNVVLSKKQKKIVNTRTNSTRGTKAKTTQQESTKTSTKTSTRTSDGDENSLNDD